jgi:hypothetical protein
VAACQRQAAAQPPAFELLLQRLQLARGLLVALLQLPAQLGLAAADLQLLPQPLLRLALLRARSRGRAQRLGERRHLDRLLLLLLLRRRRRRRLRLLLLLRLLLRLRLLRRRLAGRRLARQRAAGAAAARPAGPAAGAAGVAERG